MDDGFGTWFRGFAHARIESGEVGFCVCFDVLAAGRHDGMNKIKEQKPIPFDYEKILRMIHMGDFSELLRICKNV